MDNSITIIDCTMPWFYRVEKVIPKSNELDFLAFHCLLE
jgi:hypothetical protein